MLRFHADPVPWAMMLIVALVLSASASGLSDVSIRMAESDVAAPALPPAAGCERGAREAACAGADALSSRVSLPAATYQLGSAELPDSLVRSLRPIGEAVREQRAVVRVEVHTDASGTPEESRALSQRRADAIRAYLIELGIDPYRVQAVGMGSSRPKLPQDPLNTGNRRVDIVRL